jgi:hypothetical protein
MQKEALLVNVYRLLGIRCTVTLITFKFTLCFNSNVPTGCNGGPVKRLVLEAQRLHDIGLAVHIPKGNLEIIGYSNCTMAGVLAYPPSIHQLYYCNGLKGGTQTLFTSFVLAQNYLQLNV